MGPDQVEIKIVPQGDLSRCDVWLQNQIIAKGAHVSTAFESARAMLLVFESQAYKVSKQEDFPYGGKYWLLVKPN